MRLLVTNDDGIDSPGLVALARSAQQWLAGRPTADGSPAELLVVAPAAEQSGAAASMGSLAHPGPVEYSATELAGLEDVPTYKVATTPAGCVILSCLEAFGNPPDLVLSGINYGANCGRSVLPSGTIGAALTAVNYRVPGLAVSQDVPHKGADMLWEVAGELACGYLDWLLSQPEPTAASLNVPNLAAADIAGVQYAPPLAPLGVVVTQFKSKDERQIHTRVERAPSEVPPGTDRDLLLQGWATLAPIARPAVDYGVKPPDGVTLAATGAGLITAHS